MRDTEVFDEFRQRRTLRLLAHSLTFLNSSEGQAFLDQLRGVVAPRAASAARQLGINSTWLDSDDLVHTAIVELTHENGRVARYAAASNGEPWAYVSVCLVDWMRAQWGTRGEPFDETAHLKRTGGGHRTLAEASDGTQVSATTVTALETVIERTHVLLAPSLPAHYHEPLRALLRWCALNPPQRRSYEHVDREAATAAFPVFPERVVRLITHLCWGVRPRVADTSLMGALLRDARFRLSDSPTHVRAVLRFTREVRWLPAYEPC